MRSLFVVSFLLIAACSDGEVGDHEARCVALCEISGSAADECVESDGQDCLDECRVHTDGLSVECASCLLDASSGLRAEGFECRGPSLAPISEPSCSAFCEPADAR